MRSSTFLTYALVAMASSVVSAPVDVPLDAVLVEKREPAMFAAGMAKVGTVNVEKEFYHRRQAEASGVKATPTKAAAATGSVKAAPTSASGAKTTAAKGTVAAGGAAPKSTGAAKGTVAAAAAVPTPAKPAAAAGPTTPAAGGAEEDDEEEEE